MRVCIRAISDSNGLNEIESDWNALINKCSESPILLSGFIKQFMEVDHSNGWHPLVLILLVDDKIVGIIPLKIGRKFGFQLVKFLPKLPFSQDFVSETQYREIFVSHVLDFLFKNLHCQFVNLTLPKESWSLPILEQKCKTKGIQFVTKPANGRRVLPVEGTWEEFETVRGGNFRRKIKKIMRNLDRKGSWKITCVEKGSGQLDVVRKMLDVEGLSWKEDWRNRTGLEADQDLLMVWNGSQRMSEGVSDFNWSVWFLELEKHALAYALVFQYKAVAFIVKTSYDKRYRPFYPGIFVINAAIRELFNRKRVKKVDYLTDLPFMETWTSLISPQIGAIMSRSNMLEVMVKFMFANENVKRILKSVLAPFSEGTRAVADIFG